ncbi:M1 family metallopeptidase [Desertivirga xinjiangensis]|uniref:M1 family metallopeptidase n=1 Tax=Desertivirga xinjiangensis TaxID=539206 RepID=UPI00210CC6D0|nr:M1 family metallopeptidase [Pedobacter xinjiangensis]
MMTKIFRACLAGFAAFLFSACSTQKIVLDPVTVKANTPGSNIYRGSYPHLTDILHTKLELKLDWDSSFVIGKAWIEARPYFYPLNQVSLNAQGFRINKVALISKDDNLDSLNYKYDGKHLLIDLGKTYTNDQKFTLFIDYVAMPARLKVGEDISSPGNRGIYFINPTATEPNKPQQFWTQGEPECNSTWFPTIDGPQEKMTQEISITVPKKMVTLSNGALDFSSDNEDGTRTDFWRQEQPHSTYLTMVAGGYFSVIKDKWDDKEVNYYMEPGYARYAKLIFGKTPEMLEFFSKKLDVKYPWEKYSQIVVRDFNDGAMENTTATVFFERMNMTDSSYLDENYEDIISHELFHHWFGDLVTTESWANLPLNESFATYGEYLWNEYKYGRDFADLYGWKDTQAYFNSEKFTQNVIRFDYADSEHMFDQVSYQKGGRILHMLRKTVGDEAFFKSLTHYLKKHSYKTAEIHDLRIAFEEVTGQDLNWFFNQWFLAAGHPVLQIENTYDSFSRKSTIIIKQLQDLSKIPLYTIPLSIDIYTSAKVERKNIVVNKQSQSFTFDVAQQPELVNVDAEKYVLAEKREKKSAQEYAFQYQKAPLFMDRLEAFQALARLPLDKTAREVCISALGDKSWQIRLLAVNATSRLNEQEKDIVYPTIKSLAITDERSYVRAAAITALSKTFSSRDNNDIFLKAASDKAPSVRNALANTQKNKS